MQKALLYHEDIKPTTIDLIGDLLELSSIAQRLRNAILNQFKIFINDNLNKEKSKSIRKKKRGRRH